MLVSIGAWSNRTMSMFQQDCRVGNLLEIIADGHVVTVRAWGRSAAVFFHVWQPGNGNSNVSALDRVVPVSIWQDDSCMLCRNLRQMLHVW